MVLNGAVTTSTATGGAPSGHFAVMLKERLKAPLIGAASVFTATQSGKKREGASMTSFEKLIPNLLGALARVSYTVPVLPCL